MQADKRQFRPPRQDRSRRTLERIVGAARRILAERGVDAVTIQAVVGEAGASVGSFYARFSGKEDLLAHLVDSVRQDVISWWRNALEGAEWRDYTLSSAVRRGVALLDQSSTIASGERRALRGRPEGALAEREIQRLLREELAERLLQHRKEIRHPDPPLAVSVGLRAVFGALHDAEADAVGSAATRPQRDVLVGELGRLLLNYLSGQSGDPTRSGGVDFFDVWN